MSFKDNLKQATTLGLAYTTTTNLTSLPGTGEKEIIFLRNIKENKTSVRLANLSFGTSDANTGTILRMYREPTLSDNGSRLDVDNKLSRTGAKIASVNVFLKPKSTDKGDLLKTHILPPNWPTTIVDLNYILEPGKRILITLQNTLGGTKSHIDLEWLEIPLRKR